MMMGTHTSIALAFGATLMFAAGAVAQQPAPPASSPYNSPAGVLATLWLAGCDARAGQEVG